MNGYTLTMIIKEWPLTERPRERLMTLGAQQLSTAELLAIVLGQGGQGCHVVDVARQLLNQFDGLRGIFSANLKTLCQIAHLGPAKYCQLQATAELGRRYLLETLPQRQGIHHSRDAQRFMMAQLQDYQQEVFAALFLDNKHRIIQFEKLFYGTINYANVYPREVIKRALHHNAATLIVAHNHPSGVPEPSQDDQHITRALKKALALVDVTLLDHLVIGDCEAISLAERGWL